MPEHRDRNKTCSLLFRVTHERIRQPSRGRCGGGARRAAVAQRPRSFLAAAGPPAGAAQGLAWLPWILCVRSGRRRRLCRVRPRPMTTKITRNTWSSRRRRQSGRQRAQPGQGAGKQGQANDPALGAIVLESKGYIIPISLIQVSPKVGGMVMKLNITEGDARQERLSAGRAGRHRLQGGLRPRRGHRRGGRAPLDELWKYRDQEIEQAEADWRTARPSSSNLTMDFKRSRRSRNPTPWPTRNMSRPKAPTNRWITGPNA